uniref:Uncharacterized protein n=1 Tax=Timema genevievae TaxID=629358 RepID=A0A7R9KBM6_TIMGE|nr:unnamed protein product [Timema genevievae]
MKSLYDGFLPIKEQVKNESDSSDYENTMVKNEMKYENSSLGIMEVTRDQFIPEIKSQCFPCKDVHIWVVKFTPGGSKVTYEERPSHLLGIETNTTLWWVEEMIQADMHVTIDNGGHNQHCTSGSGVGTSQRSTEVDESCGTLLENRSLPCAGGLHAVYHHHQNGDLPLLGQDIGLP